MAMIRCTSCSYAIPPEAFQGRAAAPCPLCGRPIEARALPALAVAVRGTGGGPPALPDLPPAPGETVCFYNPEVRATTSCTHCGVFISDAWAAQWGKDTVCFKCLEDLRGKRQDIRFQSRRLLWDNIALGTAAAPFIVSALFLFLGPLGAPFIALSFIMSVVTAPTSLGLSIFAWNKPRSIVPRGRGRVVSALLLSLLQCGAWGVVFFSAIREGLE